MNETLDAETADLFKKARDKLAQAIEAVRAVQVGAGSREARMAGYALDSMGAAFMYLDAPAATPNPAWES